MQWHYTYGLDPGGFQMSYEHSAYIQADTALEALQAAAQAQWEWIPWEDWEQPYGDEDFIENYTKDGERRWLRLEEAVEKRS